jgi:nitroreductase
VNDVLDFLRHRRSRPAKMLAGPGPARAEIEDMLTIAGRVPDHGKLEPWRFVVIEGAALVRLAKSIRARAAATGADADKGAGAFEGAPLAIAVIGVPRPTEKIPAREQVLSAACATYNLLAAALASGWGANWLTGWPAYDADLMQAELGLDDTEWVAGFVHIGSCEAVPPDRPRPDIGALTTWLDA